MLSTKFLFIWPSGFRGEDLNVIFYQNIPNLHNRYKLNVDSRVFTRMLHSENLTR